MRSNKRKKKKILWIFLLILLAVGVYWFFIRSSNPNGHLPKEAEFSEDDLAQIDALLDEDGNEDGLLSNAYRIQVGKNDLEGVTPIDENILNILLLGTDSAGALNAGRTDSMMICSINKTTGEIKLSSIVRDLWVDIPHTNTQNRINAANAFGGPYLSILAVNNTFDLDITQYCSINFEGFKGLTDALGGVDIEIIQAEANQINRANPDSYVKEGLAHLNGAQALTYCRIRKLDNNFGRNERQRKFLLSVMTKFSENQSIGNYISLIRTALGYVSTNIGITEIIQLLNLFKNGAKDIQTYSCPENGQYRYETIRGMSVVTADKDRITAALHQFIYSKETK